MGHTVKGWAMEQDPARFARQLRRQEGEGSPEVSPICGCEGTSAGWYTKVRQRRIQLCLSHLLGRGWQGLSQKPPGIQTKRAASWIIQGGLTPTPPLPLRGRKAQEGGVPDKHTGSLIARTPAVILS